MPMDNPYLFKGGLSCLNLDDYINILAPNNVCCTSKKEDNTMSTMLNATTNVSSPASLFNGIFGRIAPDMCRLSMNGKVAIRTSNGYKTYNVESGSLTNCDSFAFDIGQDAFFVVPTNKIKRGDIVLIGGKPHCVISADKNRIEALCYEDSTIHNVVPERHMFLGKGFLYGKIISIFGDLGSGNGMNKIMKFMMMSQMMGGGSGNMASMMPMMMLMGNGSSFDGMFSGLFDDEDEDDKKDYDRPEREGK